jgi:O-antigen/teichoic acid export membrane protein
MIAVQPARDRRSVVLPALVAGGAAVFAGTFVWQASNFLFNSVAAHMLGPGRYANLAAVSGLAYMAGPVFLSIQTVASRMSTTFALAGEHAQIRGLYRHYAVRLALIGAVAMAVVVAASGPIARIIRLPSAAPVAVIGAVFVLSSLTHLQRGVMQGTQAFSRFGMSAGFEGIAKILLAVLLIRLVLPTETGAVLAIPLAAAVGACVNSWMLRFLPRPAERVRPIGHPYRYSIVTLATLVLLALLVSADVIAARHYLPAATAGLYAAVSLSGKVAFFATTSLSAFLFPIFSEGRDRGSDGRASLLAGLGAVGLISGVLVGGFFVAPQLLIRPLFGSGFQAAGHYIGWIGIAFGFYGAAYLVAMYLLAHKRHVALPVLGCAVVGQLAGFYVLHGSIPELIAVQATVFGGAALILIPLALLPSGHPRRLRSTP